MKQLILKNSIFIYLLCFGICNAQTLKDAIKLTDNEQFESAAKAYQVLIQNDPNNGNDYFHFGENSFKNDDWEMARKMYQKGIDVNATNPINYVGIGKILWYQKNFTEAKTNFYKAATLSKSKDASVLMKTAEVYIKADTKNLPEAFKLLTQASALEPKNPEVYILLGDAYLEQNDGNQAIINYEKATDLDKTSVKAILRTGQLFGRAKNYSLALDHYKKAEKIDSTFAPAYREKAELYYKFNQFDKATAQYKKYLALNDNYSARTRYASFLFLSKKYTEAINEIKEVQKLDTNNVVMYRLLGYSYYEAGDFPNGTINMNKFFDKATKQGTKIISSDYSYQGKLLAKTGQDSLGVTKLLTAVETEQDSTKKPDLYSEIGSTYYRSKKYVQAVIYFEKKITSSETPSATDYNNLGRAYFYSKDFVKADSAFSRITQLMPDLSLGYSWRARCNAQLDLKNEKWLAKPYYEQFIEKVKPEDIEKNKKDLIEANSYLGYYYFVKKDYTKSKSYWLKVKEYDPSNKQAKAALEDPNMK